MPQTEDILRAAKLIREGKLVAFPTETVYGLGANALDAEAVARIFELKERPSFDPLIVHIANPGDLNVLGKHPDPRCFLLAEKFWPGPLTMVVPKSDIVPDIVTSGLETVGIRMPANETALELIRAAACPIAAPSANKFGLLSPTTAQHVKKQLPGVDCILDGGPTGIGIESTVISLNHKGFEILRHGFITREDIEKYIPFYAMPAAEKTNIVSPGMLKSHYSPGKPIYIQGDYVPEDLQREKAALLSFSGNDSQGFAMVYRLTSSDDLREYAVKLFSALHQLEDEDIEAIVAEPVPMHGIGIAIMDKLKKAAHRYRNDD